MATFTPPTYDFRAPPDHPLYPIFKITKTHTVYKSGGTWYEQETVPWNTLADADVVAVGDRPGGEDWRDGSGDRYVFMGGRTYTVSAAVATELTDADFEVS